MAQIATRGAPLQPTSRRTEAFALVAGFGAGLAILTATQVAGSSGTAASPTRGTEPPVISLALAKLPAVAAPARGAPRFRLELALPHGPHGFVPAPRARPAPEIMPAVAVARTSSEPSPHLQADRPAIALIIDDMGLDHQRSAAVVGLDGRLTLSYLPYAKDLTRQTRAARTAGHELMLHLPMEPESPRVDPGPNVLAPWLPPDEIARRLRLALDSFEGYVGVNNHMGSLFTANRPAMRLVLGKLRRRNLLFVDSRTGPRSVARTVADTLGLRFAERDVFLDHEDDKRPVAERLRQLETIATRTGVAIGIGHPRVLTIAALKKWIPDALRRGFRLIPITEVVRPHPAPPAEHRLTALEARSG